MLQVNVRRRDKNDGVEVSLPVDDCITVEKAKQLILKYWPGLKHQVEISELSVIFAVHIDTKETDTVDVVTNFVDALSPLYKDDEKYWSVSDNITLGSFLKSRAKIWFEIRPHVKAKRTSSDDLSKFVKRPKLSRESAFYFPDGPERCNKSDQHRDKTSFFFEE